MQAHPSPDFVVRQFVERVRSGLEPEAACELMAPVVKAHQVVSGKPSMVERSPANYAEHIGEFLDAYGQYQLQIEEFMSAESKVYVRWRQVGRHMGTILGYAPTGRELVTVGSAVYRVESGRIVEYWIQQENAGLEAQLKEAVALDD